MTMDRTLGWNPVRGAVLGLCLMASATALAADPVPVAHYSLSKDMQADVLEDGSLLLRPNSFAESILVGGLDSLVDTRRRRGGRTDQQSWVGKAREGQVGGHRGFSSLADDDQDGLVDEDPLDGRDNDGDGLVDEDFAAISDLMTALSLTHGQGEAQLEFMQWAGPRLKNALFLGLSATHELAGVNLPNYHLESTGQPWRETDLFNRHHDLAGHFQTREGTAFVVAVESSAPDGDLTDPSALNPLDGPTVTWLGVMVLNPEREGPGSRHLRPGLDDHRLSLPLTAEPLALVVVTAPTWLQLNRLLLDAQDVYDGVSDPVSNRQARWIVSPLCSRCRLESSGEYSATLEADGSLSLALDLQDGGACLLDPDLFQLADQSLGRPDEMVWVPLQGSRATLDWAALNRTDDPNLWNEPSDPYGMLGLMVGHKTAGRLVFRFGNPAGEGRRWPDEDIPLLLSGVWQDGRPFVTEAQLVRDQGILAETEVEPSVSGWDSPVKGDDDNRLSLSAALLDGWPNPFRDQITIEFKVPSSLGETFDFENFEEVPEDLDLSAPMDWSGGQPSVSVKVYSINGQELVSLQQGVLSEGLYTVTWNGTDSYGRQVASGTYFCKLQLDDMSVTRRLVFIR